MTNEPDSQNVQNKQGILEGAQVGGDVKIGDIDQSTKNYTNKNDVKYPNYYVLLSYLKENEWQKADRETFYLMRQIAGLVDLKELSEKELSCNKSVQISCEQLDNFECEALCAIDASWNKYSGNKFGFSVQYEIFTKIVGEKKDITPEAWIKFGKEVDWHNGKKWIDDYVKYKTPEEIPRGHYPLDVIGGSDWENGSKQWVSKLMSRLVKCKKLPI
ncbi:hypothetical protein FM036_12940 [Nostoc sp. HG1]|nr:hypothetical protein [Nostoc sp. HG1]